MKRIAKIMAVVIMLIGIEGIYVVGKETINTHLGISSVAWQWLVSLMAMLDPENWTTR